MLNTLDFFLLLNTTSWMYDYRELVYPKTLYEITIPGTHDSGSYNLSKDIYVDVPEVYKDLMILGEYLKLPIHNIVTGWTKTQNVDITSQLKLGSRYLDLRLYFYKNRWHIHHNFIIGLQIEIILDQIFKFLFENQGELLIIEISHVENTTDYNIKILNNTIYDKLGTFMYKNSRYKNETINKLIGRGERLFIISDIDIFMYKNTIINNWANTDNITLLVDYSDTLMKNWLNKSYESLIKLDWVLTPTIETVILDILNNGSLYRIEKNLDNVFNKWKNDYINCSIKKCPIFPNIISIDFIDKGDITKYVLVSLFKCNNIKTKIDYIL